MFEAGKIYLGHNSHTYTGSAMAWVVSSRNIAALTYTGIVQSGVTGNLCTATLLLQKSYLAANVLQINEEGY